MKKKAIFHPFIFGAFPVVSLYLHNSDIASPDVILRPLLATTAFAALLLLLFRALLKDSRKAGIAVSVFLLVFFSYEYMLLPLEGNFPGIGDSTLRTCLDIVLCLMFIFFTKFLAGRKAYASGGLTGILNISAIALLLLPTLNAGYALANKVVPESRPVVHAQRTAGAVKPDIYFIVLDGYARHDTMEDIYGYNNAKFLNFLKEQGFFVAQNATSNYAQTYLSLSATLNLEYLDGLAGQLGDGSDDRGPLVEMLRNNTVAAFLKGQGYRTVAFSSGYTGTEMTTTDEYIKPFMQMSEFENVLVNTTPLAGILDTVQYNLHRERVLRTFRCLPDIHSQGKPLFVFAHIVSPHPPFVFGEGGAERAPDGPYGLFDGSYFIKDYECDKALYLTGYCAQARFISDKVMEMLEKLFSRPGPKPVIVLMADHGPGLGLNWEDPSRTDFHERMSILEAIYLPDGKDAILYDGITPVNTFRVIFDKYFGTNLKLLPDRSYFSTWSRPYRFLDVTQEVRVPGR